MIYRIITIYFANIVGFLLAGYLIPGFDLIDSLSAFFLLMLLISAIQLIILPIIKLVLSPLIFATFGLFNIVINGVILYLVDIYSQNISIDGLIAILVGTVLISFVQVLMRGGKY